MSARTDSLKPHDAQPARAARTLLTPRWLLTTLLVLAAVAVMVRLGIWQLDRLALRRAINQQHARVLALPPLDLNQPFPTDLTQATYRAAVVIGTYDYSGEVLLRNQAWNDRPGYHLLTPLVIQGSQQAVLVNRGWIPLEDAAPERRAAYQPPGEVQLSGRLMPAQQEPRFGGMVDPTLSPGETRLEAWNWVNLERIQHQVNRPLLPLYLIAAPSTNLPEIPARSLPEVDLSEGSHMSYALQWFAFALILSIGYPFYVRNQLGQHR